MLRRRLSSLALATWENAERRSSILNLGIGQPARGLLPTEAVASAAAELPTAYDPFHWLQYGSPAGGAHYLSAVASFLSEELNCKHEASNIFATPGNSAALALVTRTLTNPGDRVLIEDPSYFLAHQVFRDYGLDFIPLPQTSESISGTLDIAIVEKTLWRCKYLNTSKGEPMPSMLYLVPSANNPTGSTMPDADRSQLVRLCAEYSVVIIADDVYEALQFGSVSSADGDGAAPPRPMRWHAAEQGVGRAVISLGSWSKLLGPGLRMGWMDCDPAYHTAFAKDGELDSGSWTAPLVESIVARMVERGDVASHTTALRAALSRRAMLLADAINGQQPEGAPPIVDAATGGYFQWVRLGSMDAPALRDRCVASHGVSFLPGERCALLPESVPSRARVCFAFLEEDELVEAATRLGRAIAAGSSD